MKKSFILTAIAVAVLSVLYFANITLAGGATIINGWAVTDNASNITAVVFEYGLNMEEPSDYSQGKIQISTQDGSNFQSNIVSVGSSTVLQSATITTLNLSGMSSGTYYWRIALLDGTDITTGSYGSFTL